jgi:hypothetical protein
MFAPLGTDAHHHGIVLKPALDVFHGKALFGETLTQYGPLTTYFHSLSFFIWGERLASLNYGTAIFYSFSAVLMFEILILFLPKVFSFFSVLIFFMLAHFIQAQFFPPWSAVFAMSFQLGAILIFLHYLQNQRRLYLFFASFLMVSAFWCKQPVGIFGEFGLVVILVSQWLIHRSFKKVMGELWIAGLGGVLAIVPLVLVFAMTHSMLDWYRQNIVMGYYFEHRYGNSPAKFLIIRTLLFAGRHVDHGTWLVAVATGCFTTLVSFFYLFKTNPSNKVTVLRLWTLSVLGFASWMHIYPITSPHHLFHGSVVFFLLMAISIYYFFYQFARKIWLSSVLALVLLGLIWSPVIHTRYLKGKEKLTSYTYTVDEIPLFKGMHFASNQAAFYRGADAAMQKLPKEFLPARYYGGDALYFCLWPDKIVKNKIGIQWNIVDDTYPGYHEAYVEDFKRSKSAYLVGGVQNTNDVLFISNIIMNNQIVFTGEGGHNNELTILKPFK